MLKSLHHLLTQGNPQCSGNSPQALLPQLPQCHPAPAPGQLQCLHRGKVSDCACTTWHQLSVTRLEISHESDIKNDNREQILKGLQSQSSSFPSMTQVNLYHISGSSKRMQNHLLEKVTLKMEMSLHYQILQTVCVTRRRSDKQPFNHSPRAVSWWGEPLPKSWLKTSFSHSDHYHLLEKQKEMFVGASDFNKRQQNAFPPEDISLWKRELSCVIATAEKYFAASSDAPFQSRGSSTKPGPLQCVCCDIWCFFCHKVAFFFICSSHSNYVAYGCRILNFPTSKNMIYNMPNSTGHQKPLSKGDVRKSILWFL